MMQTLMIWNDYQFNDLISSCFTDPLMIVKNEEQIERINFREFNRIFILIELNYNHRNITELYGLKLAQKIRREFKASAPIIFCSFMDLEKDFFSNKKLSAKSLILKASGSYFLRLPFTKDQIIEVSEKASALSSAGLIDVIEKCCNPVGAIIDKLHPLKTPFDDISLEDFNNVRHAIDALLTEENKSFLEFAQITKSAADKIREKDLNGFRTLIQRLENNCMKLQTLDDKSPFAEIKCRISVLLLEDNVEICEKIKSELYSRNIDVKYFTDHKQAMDELAEDVCNKYCVIIADWRLYKNQQEQWQELQGYDFLDAAAQIHFIAPIALTSLNDSSVHEIRNNLEIKIDLFKKEYLLYDNNWDIFSDIIWQKHNDINEIICSQPTGKEWQKTWHAKYRTLRLKVEWQKVEAQISRKASELYTNFSKYFNDDIVIPITEFNIPLNNILNVLILRRIWLSLWARRNEIDKTDSISGIYMLLNQLSYYDIEKTITDKDIDMFNPEEIDQISKGKINFDIHHYIARKKVGQRAKFLQNKLGIETENLHLKGILPEEKAWLHKIGLSIEPHLTEENKTVDTEPEPSDSELFEFDINSIIDEDPDE